MCSYGVNLIPCKIKFFYALCERFQTVNLRTLMQSIFFISYCKSSGVKNVYFSHKKIENLKRQKRLTVLQNPRTILCLYIKKKITLTVANRVKMLRTIF